jgi:hypothetical protein
MAIDAPEAAPVAARGAQHDAAHGVLEVLAPALRVRDRSAPLRVGGEQRRLRHELVEHARDPP